MKNFIEDTKLDVQSYYSENEVKAIFKTGLRNYSVSTLSLYLECLVEVINEKKEAEREKQNGENGTD